MTNRIEWANGPYSSTNGTVGKFPLFSTGYQSGDQPYRLSTTLPVRMKTTSFTSQKDAQAYAERVLISFVKNIGAVFPKTEV